MYVTFTVPACLSTWLIMYVLQAQDYFRNRGAKQRNEVNMSWMRLQQCSNPSRYQDPSVNIYEDATAKDPFAAAEEIKHASNFAELETRLTFALILGASVLHDFCFKNILLCSHTVLYW